MERLGCPEQDGAEACRAFIFKDVTVYFQGHAIDQVPSAYTLGGKRFLCSESFFELAR
jgi:hypothetical protein